MGIQSRTTAERFWSKVEKTDGCWLWAAGKNAHGYGRFSFNSQGDYAHRVAYRLGVGPIPDGLFVCHHCDNPSCVRPDHLFLGTDADNNADKAAKGRNVNPLTDAFKAVTHCPQKHEYDTENTLWRTKKNGHRYRACRACLRAWAQRYYREKRQKAG